MSDDLTALMTNFRLLSLNLFTAVLATAGCSRLPDLAPVSGRVTLDGQPLEFGGMMFQPSCVSRPRRSAGGGPHSRGSV